MPVWTLPILKEGDEPQEGVVHLEVHMQGRYLVVVTTRMWKEEDEEEEKWEKWGSREVAIYDFVRQRHVRTLHPEPEEQPYNVATYKRGIAWSAFCSTTIHACHFIPPPEDDDRNHEEEEEDYDDDEDEYRDDLQPSDAGTEPSSSGELPRVACCEEEEEEEDGSGASVEDTGQR
jgi:hypothetical protein